MNRIVSEGRNAEKTKKGCIETEPTPQRGTHQRRVWGSQRALTSGPEWDVLLVLTTLQSLGLEATVSSPFPSLKWDRALMSRGHLLYSTDGP